MPAEYTLLFRPEVAEDLRSLGRSGQARVLKALQERLTRDPASYGKPLGGSLAGLRRIRIGDYRAAYQVREKDAVVWAVKHRKDVYEEVERRFLGR